VNRPHKPMISPDHEYPPLPYFRRRGLKGGCRTAFAMMFDRNSLINCSCSIMAWVNTGGVPGGGRRSKVVGSMLVFSAYLHPAHRK